MKMLQKKGIKIPKKLKVVGYDGLDFTRFLRYVKDIIDMKDIINWHDEEM
jgi:hypothetical protein